MSQRLSDKERNLVIIMMTLATAGLLAALILPFVM
jgi:hypothetical protein